MNFLEKVAVTVMSEFKVTVQVFVPVHPPPLQPLKVETELAAALREIEVPLLNLCEQSVPQLISVPVTVPSPDPPLLTVRVKVCLIKEMDVI